MQPTKHYFLVLLNRHIYSDFAHLKGCPLGKDHITARNEAFYILAICGVTR